MPNRLWSASLTGAPPHPDLGTHTMAPVAGLLKRQGRAPVPGQGKVPSRAGQDHHGAGATAGHHAQHGETQWRTSATAPCPAWQKAGIMATVVSPALPGHRASLHSRAPADDRASVARHRRRMCQRSRGPDATGWARAGGRYGDGSTAPRHRRQAPSDAPARGTQGRTRWDDATHRPPGSRG